MKTIRIEFEFPSAEKARDFIDRTLGCAVLSYRVVRVEGFADDETAQKVRDLARSLGGEEIRS